MGADLLFLTCLAALLYWLRLTKAGMQSAALLRLACRRLQHPALPTCLPPASAKGWLCGQPP